jgi:hypothetical protein
MLHRLLQIISSGGVHNPTQLAQQLGVDNTLLDSMLDNLVRMGYLRLMSAECCGDCDHCPTGNMCAIGGYGRVWVLTEAGHKVAQANPSPLP